MQRHPGHTPDAKEAASLAPLTLLNTAYTPESDQLLDSTHTHTHTPGEASGVVLGEASHARAEGTYT